jgi:hypothetical protein
MSEIRSRAEGDPDIGEGRGAPRPTCKTGLSTVLLRLLLSPLFWRFASGLRSFDASPLSAAAGGGGAVRTTETATAAGINHTRELAGGL